MTVFLKMKYKILFFCAVLLFILGGCSDGQNKMVNDLNLKIDSLEKVNASNKTDLVNLTSFIETLSDGLDSIAVKENSLFYTNQGKERTIRDRKQLKKNLEMFAQTLSNQRQRIALLTDSLKRSGANISKLNSIVAYLNQQLDNKERMIRSLQKELDQKNVDLSELSGQVSSLSEENLLLTEKVEKQSEAIKTQNDILNEGYVKIGTKKELKDGGLISGGFLKKNKINYNSLSKDGFQCIDIRTYTEIEINSGTPKVLTPMPTSSYEIRKVGKNKAVLHIIDPTSFWSITNYLIIQI